MLLSSEVLLTIKVSGKLVSLTHLQLYFRVIQQNPEVSTEAMHPSFCISEIKVNSSQHSLLTLNFFLFYGLNQIYVSLLQIDKLNVEANKSEKK